MTRLSFAQARALNIDEDIIRRAEQITPEGERFEPDDPPKPKRTKPADGYDSKLERDFAECLKRAEREQWILRWWHHPCGFRLAPKCYYHPDFMVHPVRYSDFAPPNVYTPQDDPRLVFVEVKGGWWCEHTKVKTKVVAPMYPCFRWLLVYREKRNGWDVREVNHAGIGTFPIIVPWIRNI